MSVPGLGLSGIVYDVQQFIAAERDNSAPSVDG